MGGMVNGKSSQKSGLGRQGRMVVPKRVPTDAEIAERELAEPVLREQRSLDAAKRKRKPNGRFC